MSNLKKAISNPLSVFSHLAVRGWFHWIPDKLYIKVMYRSQIKKRLDLDNPKTLDEKLQWLKLYDRQPRYTKMVDKYEAKRIAADILGDEHVIPTLGVWDHFDEINFDDLPDQFVLKCTHDSGGLVICREKASFDFTAAKKKIEKSLKNNYYWAGREWPYKNLKPRIIAEEYKTDTVGSGGLTDFKFYCFHGVADGVLVCLDRGTGDAKFYFFGKDWKLKRYNKRGKEAPEGFTIPKPETMDQMFEAAEKLSANIPFVRIDLYQSCGQFYFGELTFYPSSGYDPNRLLEANLYFGSKIHLEKV